MQFYDVTLPLKTGIPVWPGDPQVELQRVMKMEDGDSCNVTFLSMSAHSGTHVDAPYHFLGGDSARVEDLPLKVLIGRAYVLHLPDAEVITAQVLEKALIPPRTRRLLLKTRNSDYWKARISEFQPDFVAISPDGAQLLVDRGVRLVGVDYLSVAPFQDGAPTHQVLLRAGVVVVEGLNLSDVAPGRYNLHCLPLKLAGADGAPARVILVGV